MAESDIERAFPELDEIADAELRAQVVRVWEDALAESDFDDIHDLPWWPPHQEIVGEEWHVPHVRDVVACALALTDALNGRQGTLDVDRDVVVAGALLHDVSKLFEIDGVERAPFDDLLPHPHFAVHLLAEAGLSTHLQHVALAHSGGSAVEPKTMEALVVQTADFVAANSIFWRRVGHLKP